MPLSDRLALELERWLKVGREGYVNDPENEYLFPSPKNGKLKTSRSLEKIVRDAAEKAGIQEVTKERELTDAEKERCSFTSDTKKWYRVTPHVLRHTFIENLREAGLDAEARSQALDHESIETTEEHYTHRGTEHIEKIRQAMNST